jgi:tRNA(Ile)-lysidine synthase
VDSKIRLIRPLLDAAKAELRESVRERKIRFRDDATNTSLDMPRNRVRNELLPLLLRHYQPALPKTVLRLMEIVGAEAETVGETARQWLVSKRKIERVPRPVTFHKPCSSGRESAPSYPNQCQSRLTSAATIRGVGFDYLPVAVQRRVLQLQLSEAGVPADFELIESLRQSADVPVNLGPQLSVLREATGAVSLRLARPSDFNANESSVHLAGRAGEVEFDGVRFGWRFEAGANFAWPHGQKACESFDADKVGGNITLRHWRPGDRFQPIGLKSPVKLQDLFTNRKIPRARRRELMVAAAENHEIFWVEGLRISENFKLTPQTRRRLVWRWRRLARV